MIFNVYYVITLIYCLVLTFKNIDKRSPDGVIGMTPGFDVLTCLILCWVLAPADIFFRTRTYLKNLK